MKIKRATLSFVSFDVAINPFVTYRATRKCSNNLFETPLLAQFSTDMVNNGFIGKRGFTCGTSTGIRDFLCALAAIALLGTVALEFAING